MQYTRRISITLVALGLLVIFAALTITPAFATKYLSSDHDISPAGIAQLRTYRLFMFYLGIFMMITGAILGSAPEGKSGYVVKWLTMQLTSERVWVALIIVAGSVIRLFHLFIVGTDSPFRYGGLFLEFAEQIARNEFRLPETIPYYTVGGIPFAYPPLPFYIEAIAIYRLGLTPYAVVNMLPPLISILTIPAYYVLARAAGLERRGRLIAVAAFAFMPSAIFEQIEAAGLAESFGTLALALFLASLFQTLRSEASSLYHNHRKYFIIGITWTFCIVASPGSAYASVLCFLTFSIAILLRGKSFSSSMLRLAFAGTIALALSSPYWLSVVNKHGLGVFLNSIGGQYSGSTMNFQDILLDFQMVGGPYAFPWNLLIFLGVIVGYMERRFWLLVLLFVFATIPRESSWLLSLPSGLILGTEADSIIPLARNSWKMHENKIQITAISILMLSWIGIGPVTTMLANPFAINSSFEPKIVEAMQWLRVNTPPDGKVVAISELHVQEWLPRISQRTVINMPFGSEWQPDEALLIQRMESALGACKDLDCVLSSAQIVVNSDQFVLFADREKLDSLMQECNHEAEFHLLWKNERIGIGLLCRLDTCR